MPPVPAPAEPSSAFTVIHHEGQRRLEAARPQLPRSVNVVKPLQHEEAPLAVAVAAPPAPPNTILDPKFSRALDFKLRRLKEKEILQANLRRPTRPHPRLAASNPNVSAAAFAPRRPARLARSHPRLDAPDEERSTLDSSNMETSPSPGAGRYSRSREPDKPRFVTTVKTGQFLPPPPELACLLGLQALYPEAERERIVYEYSSKPKAVAPRAKRATPGPPGAGPQAAKRAHLGAALGGVRALLAGVAAMHTLHTLPDTWVHIISLDQI